MVRRCILLLLVGTLGISVPTFAARVLAFHGNELVISQQHPRQWRRGDYVCVYRKDSELACGKITKAGKTSLVQITKRAEGVSREVESDQKTESYVELTFGELKIRKGDEVKHVIIEEKGAEEEDSYANNDAWPTVGGYSIQQRGQQRGLSSSGSTLVGKDDLLLEIEPRFPADDEEETPDEADRDHNITAGLTYLFPTVRYEYAVTDHFTAGVASVLMLSTKAGDGNLKGWGAFATLNYYSKESFNGWWAMAGVGAYSLTGSFNNVDTNFASPALMATFGYRKLWRSGLNAGAAVGGQYLTYPNPAENPQNFSGFLPTVSVDLGFSF